MRRVFLATLLIASMFAAAPAFAQATHLTTGASLPTNCTVGDTYVKTGSSAGLYRCSATDTWTLQISAANLGTGVQAALAIAVGSAGGPVVLNGAGGTPSAIVLTNATAVPAGQIVGVIPIANLATGTPTGSKFIRDDGTLQAIAGGGDALVANPLSQFAATTSAQFKGVISDENAPDGASSKVLMALGSVSIASGKTVTFSNTFTATATDSSTIAFGAGGTVLYSTAIDNTAYDATTWNGVSTKAPSQDAVRDKFESLLVITAPATGTDLGAAATAYRNLWIYGQGTYGSTSVKFDSTPTGNRVWTIPDATDTAVGKATTDTLTNKTYDVEGTGNVFTMVGYTIYTPAVVQGSTATLGMSCLSALCPTATSLTGTNVPRAGAQFPDSDGEFHVAGDIALASDFTGTADFKGQLRFESDTNTGHAFRIQIQWACTASGAVGNDTWSTAATVDVSPDGTTTHYVNWSKTGVTLTSCSASNDMAFRLMRQRTDAADTVTGTVELMPFGIYLRRAQ